MRNVPEEDYELLRLKKAMFANDDGSAFLDVALTVARAWIEKIHGKIDTTKGLDGLPREVRIVLAGLVDAMVIGADIGIKLMDAYEWKQCGGASLAEWLCREIGIELGEGDE